MLNTHIRVSVRKLDDPDVATSGQILTDASAKLRDLGSELRPLGMKPKAYPRRLTRAGRQERHPGSRRVVAISLGSCPPSVPDVIPFPPHHA